MHGNQLAQVGYRADIDGLRALAVVPVILFHAGVTHFKGIPFAAGGYVGVDIFFVISGYLITGIVYSKINSKTYSVFEFYARRVRRIFPMLFVVYLACLLWAVTRSVPAEVIEIRNAVVASIFFVSNLYFAANAGYFDASIQGNPLLHTWSLSIEEQFYIFVPFILLCIRRMSHLKRVGVLAGLALVSLAASVYLSKVYPDAAYYSFAARAWELGIGGLLAIVKPNVKARFPREVLASVGFIAIIISLMAFNEDTEFPGFAALLPTLGTAAIILAGTSGPTLVAKCLSLRPIRAIGLISYSLYLWHWPILVIMRLEGFEGKKAVIIAIAICFAVSALSWYLIEQPFRSARFTAPPKQTVFWGGAAMVCTTIFALFSNPLHGLVLPMNGAANSFAAYDEASAEAAMRPGLCFLTSQFDSLEYYKDDTCLKLDPGRRNVLLIGDSHAAQYYSALSALSPSINVLQATASGCLPLTKTVGEARCVELWTHVTSKFLPGKKLDAIFMVGRWQPGTATRAYETAKFLTQFSEQVFIIGPNEEFSTSMPKLLTRAALLGNADLVGMYVKQGNREIEGEFQALDKPGTNVTYLSFFEAVCGAACPPVSKSGEPLNFDDNHVSPSTAGDLLAAVRPKLSKLE